MSLCRRLESNYPLDFLFPVAILDIDISNEIMEELMGNDLDDIYYRKFADV